MYYTMLESSMLGSLLPLGLGHGTVSACLRGTVSIPESTAQASERDEEKDGFLTSV